MELKGFVLAVVLAVMAGGTPSSIARAQEGPVQLTLQGAAQLAVDNGLAKRLEAVNLEAARNIYRAEQGRFLPSVSAEGGFRRQIVGTELAEAVDERGRYSETTPHLSIGVGGKLPFGATYDLRARSQILWTTMQKAIIAPQFLNSLEIEVTQPLLRGFGTRATTMKRETARMGRDVALYNINVAELKALREVVAAYWRLYTSIQSTAAIRDAMKQTKEHRDGYKKLPKDKQPDQVSDLLNESQLNIYENMKSRLQKQRIKAEAGLLLLIYSEHVGAQIMMRGVVPTDKPHFVPVRYEPAELFRKATQHRPEIKTLQVQIKAQELRVAEAKKSSLPKLDAYALGGLHSFMGQQHLLGYDPVTGELPPTAPDVITGRYGDAWGQMITAKLPRVEAGLRFEMPLSSAVRHEKHGAMIGHLQRLKLRLSRMQSKIEVELREAYLQLKNDERRYRKVADEYEAMRERVNKAIEAFSRGETQTTFVSFIIQALSYAADAVGKAGADYMISRANLEAATGDLPKFLRVKSFQRNGRR